MIFLAVLGQGTGAAPAGNATNGKAVYMKAGCYACHGSMGQGGPGGRLAPNVIPSPIFSKYVRSGKLTNPNANRNWSGMPPFSTKFLSDAEIADIYAYMASIPVPPPVKEIPILNN
jgi:ubiquinol-cytochrome c reductase cytochrome c subunit